MIKRLLLIFILVPTLLTSQDLRFVHLNQDNGLSQGTVWKIMQDTYGFMWVCTDDGLNKYDGYKFTQYKFNTQQTGSISNNSIYDIVEDKNGTIWLATAYGLNCYCPFFNKFTVYLNDTTNTNTIPDNLIRCLAYDKNNHILWAGTDHGALFTVDIDNNKIENINNPWANQTIKSQVKIKTIHIDNTNNIWVGTSKGLYKSNINKLNFKIIDYKSNEPDRQKIKNTITCIYSDNNNTIWYGTDGGHVSTIDTNGTITDYGKNHKIKELEYSGRIRAITHDKHNNLWVATYNGLAKFNPITKKFDTYSTQNPDQPFSLTSNRLLTLYLDKAGSLWIGNYENGVNILHNTKPWFQYLKSDPNNQNSLNHNVVLSFAEDSKLNTYIGTYGGLNYFDRSKNIVSRFKNPKLNKAVLSIFVENDNKIWIGTWGDGLKLFNPIQQTIKSFTQSDNHNSLINNTILFIYPDPQNNQIIWIGTYGGLSMFNNSTNTFTNYTKKNGLANNVVYCIEGTADTLWIGTKDGGMSVFDKKKQTFINYLFDIDNPESIVSNTVNHINNQGHYLYIATKQGFCIFNKTTQKFKAFTEQHGLPNNYVLSTITDNNNNIWLSTNNGLCRIKHESLNNKTLDIRTFTVNDGIQGKEFTQGGFYKSVTTGELFFGGVNGANIFNPQNITENLYIPPVNITSFKLFDVDAKTDTNIIAKKNIKLSYNENFISFEFVGLDYLSTEKNLYSYKMEGLDKDWSLPSDRRYASYPDLKPGHYTFKVKAANSRGIWNQNGASFNITITPPFWQTTWFITCSIILLIVVIILIIRHREKQLQHDKRVLEDTVAERTLELRKKNHDITSSIQYAKRIQEAIILPRINAFMREFDESFVLFRPKDIVSGDFFWYTKINQTRIFAVADCTGHGVPGAFMSIIGNNLLDKIVNEKGITSPDQILNNLKTDLVQSLNQDGKIDTKDGMDIAIISHTIGNNYIEFSGAYRPLIQIQNGELIKHQADKISLGGIQNLEAKYSNQRIEIKDGDCIYAFSDGYPDQFGGPMNKKFLVKKLTNLLLSINNINMIEQDILLEDTLVEWIGDNTQIDDILLIGLKFTL